MGMKSLVSKDSSVSEWDVVQTADDVIDQIDIASLACHYGTLLGSEDEDKNARKKEDTIKTTLLEALASKLESLVKIIENPEKEEKLGSGNPSDPSDEKWDLVEA